MYTPVISWLLLFPSTRHWRTWWAGYLIEQLWNQVFTELRSLSPQPMQTLMRWLQTAYVLTLKSSLNIHWSTSEKKVLLMVNHFSDKGYTVPHIYIHYQSVGRRDGCLRKLSCYDEIQTHMVFMTSFSSFWRNNLLWQHS